MGSTIRTYIDKLIACLLAVALIVSLSFASAFADTKIHYEDKDFDTSGQFESSIYLIGQKDGFSIADPQFSMFEKEYTSGSAIEMYVVGISSEDASGLSATWRVAQALESADYSAAYTTSKVVSSSSDTITFNSDTNTATCKHFPQNDNLEEGKTYWYWLEVKDSSGNIAKQNEDKPFVVVREEGYRVGPFYDDIEGKNYTWMVAGGPTAEIDGVDTDTGVTGAIYRGAVLASSAMDKTSPVYAAFESASNGKLSIEGVWQVALTGIDEGHDAYKQDILVKLNTSSLAGFDAASVADYRLMALDAKGKWNVITLADKDAAASLGITDVSITEEGITFKLTGTNTTGEIGSFALSKVLSPEDEKRAFSVETRASAGGQIDTEGATFAYGSCPEFLFEAYSGYEVDKVSLIVSGTEYVIPHASDTDAPAPYGTYSGNSYTFPSNFNEDGRASRVVFSVEFKQADTGEASTLTLTSGAALGDVPHGDTYVGEKIPATRVEAGKTLVFEVGKQYGSYTLEENKPLTLYFAPAQGCKVDCVTINNEEFKVEGDTYTIPSFNKDMTIAVSFAFGSGEPTKYFTVSANYNKEHARVGFGQTNTQWVSSVHVAKGNEVVLVIEPKDDYVLDSAILSYGAGTPQTDVTSWVTKENTLTITNVQKDTVVSFAFKKPGKPTPPDDAKPIGPDETATVKPSNKDENSYFDSGDAHEVLDKVVVDGTVILDDEYEIKDDPAAMAQAGITYDATTGEYAFIDKDTGMPGDSFTLDPITGSIVFHSPQDTHTISGEFTPAKDMDIKVETDIDTETSLEGKGAVVPSGKFQWKQKNDLPIVIQPESGSKLVSLKIDGQEIDISTLKAATDADIAAAEEVQNRNTKQRDASYKMRSQAINSKRSLSSLLGIEKAYAASAAGADDKVYVITSDYLKSRATDLIEVDVKFAPKGGGGGALQNDTYTITAKAKGKGGMISGTSNTDETLSVQVKAGANYSVNYTIETGYRVVSIEDNGVNIPVTTGSSYTISNIDKNHDVVITFGPISSKAPRGVHRLQSLAKTGDLNAPIATGLVGIAALASATAVLLYRRRNTNAK
ncbi:hypothetical protein [Adlercreutzia sp. ZJ154]|uniref:hypothetical protein n=1 Tax=Adlercreutzia sp. ZJ154 TaxID=2709790 RepID=UPI0013EE0A81|nr:hypothetical protein [Adlercreutzia sp. ZJ154]